MAEGAAQNHLTLVADHDDRTGRFARADRFLDCRRDGGERLGQEGGGGRSRHHDGRHGHKQKMKSEAGHGTRRHPMWNKIGFLGKAKIFYRFQGFKATVPMPAVLISFLRDSAVAVYWLTGFHSIQPWEPNFSQALI